MRSVFYAFSKKDFRGGLSWEQVVCAQWKSHAFTDAFKSSIYPFYLHQEEESMHIPVNMLQGGVCQVTIGTALLGLIGAVDAFATVAEANGRFRPDNT
jgi:hypothetical protein